MALIKCSECGKEISDRAASCIHCGCPVGNAQDGVLRVELSSFLKLFASMSILVKFNGYSVVIKRGYYQDFLVPADGKNRTIQIYCSNIFTPTEYCYDRVFEIMLRSGESKKINICYNDGAWSQHDKWQYSEEYFVTK